MVKKGLVKNFAIFIEKKLLLESLFNKVTQFEINNASSYVLYMINIAKGH